MESLHLSRHAPTCGLCSLIMIRKRPGLSCSSGWNHDIVELLDALSDADWCRGHGSMSMSHIKQSLPLRERSSALLSNSRSADFSTLILLARATNLLLCIHT